MARRLHRTFAAMACCALVAPVGGGPEGDLPVAAPSAGWPAAIAAGLALPGAAIRLNLGRPPACGDGREKSQSVVVSTTSAPGPFFWIDSIAFFAPALLE